jgi:YidC/Oxa1 family membrane protein insertase
MEIVHILGSIFGAILHPFILLFINLLIGFYNLLSFFHFPSPLGFSIILITIVLRLITYPLVAKQLRVTKKMQDLAPHLSEIKKKYKGDSKRIYAEQKKLYSEHGVSQLAGCLPSLIQLPVIYGLYSVMNNIVNFQSTKLVDYINSLVIPPLRITHPLDPGFFGIALGKTPMHLISVVGAGIILVPVITGLLQLIQSRMMSPLPIKEYKSDSPKEKKEKETTDVAIQMQGQMLYLLPIMIGYFSFSFPLALSLYWNTFTIFGIIQQYQIQGWGGLAPLVNKVWKKK